MESLPLFEVVLPLERFVSDSSWQLESKFSLPGRRLSLCLTSLAHKNTARDEENTCKRTLTELQGMTFNRLTGT